MSLTDDQPIPFRIRAGSRVEEIEGQVNRFIDWLEKNIRETAVSGSTFGAYKLVSGRVEVTTGAGGGVTQLITFASDSDQGDPKFTSKPRVVATAEEPLPGVVWDPLITLLSPFDTTQVTLQAKELNKSVGATFHINWFAYGPA